MEYVGLFRRIVDRPSQRVDQREGVVRFLDKSRDLEFIELLGGYLLAVSAGQDDLRGGIDHPDHPVRCLASGRRNGEWIDSLFWR